MNQKVFLKGYWETNLGDDLFVKVVCDRYPDITFFLEATSKNLRVFKDIGNLELIEIRTDFFSKLYRKIRYPILGFSSYFKLSKIVNIFIEIGGSIFILPKNGQLDNAYKKRMKIKKISEKYFVIGSNFGPFFSQVQLDNYYNFFKEIDGTVFRDEDSYNLFKEISNVSLAPDVVFNLSVDNTQASELFICISIIDLYSRAGFDNEQADNYEKWVTNVVSSFIQKGKKVVLMGFCESENDGEAIKRVVNKVESNDRENIIVYIHKDIEQSLYYIKNSELIIATRFHAMILGWLYRKKTIVLSYSKKINNTIDKWYPEQAYINIKKINQYDFNFIGNEANRIPYQIHSNMIRLAENQFKFLDEILKD